MHLSSSRISRTYSKNNALGFHGQGLAEYSLVLALVAVACIGSLTLLGGTVGNGMNQIGSSIGSAVSASANNAFSPGGNPPPPPSGISPPPGGNGPVATAPPPLPSGGDTTTPVLGNTVTVPTDGNASGPIATVPANTTVTAPGGITLPETVLISSPTSTKPPTDIIGVPSSAQQ